MDIRWLSTPLKTHWVGRKMGRYHNLEYIGGFYVGFGRNPAVIKWNPFLGGDET